MCEHLPTAAVRQAGRAQAVERPTLNKRLEPAFVEILRLDAGKKVRQRSKGTSCRAFADYLVCNAAPEVFYRVKPKADRVGEYHRKVAKALVVVGWQNRYAHALALPDHDRHRVYV